MQPDVPDSEAGLDAKAVVAGTWLDATGGSLAEREGLVLALARRQGTTPRAVTEELRAVDAAFDVDGVYVAPERDGR